MLQDSYGIWQETEFNVGKGAARYAVRAGTRRDGGMKHGASARSVEIHLVVRVYLSGKYFAGNKPDRAVGGAPQGKLRVGRLIDVEQAAHPFYANTRPRTAHRAGRNNEVRAGVAVGSDDGEGVAPRPDAPTAIGTAGGRTDDHVEIRLHKAGAAFQAAFGYVHGFLHVHLLLGNPSSVAGDVQDCDDQPDRNEKET